MENVFYDLMEHGSVTINYLSGLTGIEVSDLKFGIGTLFGTTLPLLARFGGRATRWAVCCPFRLVRYLNREPELTDVGKQIVKVLGEKQIVFNEDSYHCGKLIFLLRGDKVTLIRADGEDVISYLAPQDITEISKIICGVRNRVELCDKERRKVRIMNMLGLPTGIEFRSQIG